MFRDFVYLDLDRVQSILAQLEQGLLTELLESKGREFQGSAGVSGLGIAGLIAQFLPVSASVEGSATNNVGKSKVLHDFAFSASMKLLEEHNLLHNGSTYNWSQVSTSEAEFLLLRGSGGFIDYEMLESFAKNEALFARITSGSSAGVAPEPSLTMNRQQRRASERQGTRLAEQEDLPRHPTPMQTASEFVSGYLGNTVLFKLTNGAGTEFVGPLERIHLRESMSSLIFKYGAAPQGTWVMLALLTRVPSKEETEQRGPRVNELMARTNEPGTRTVAEIIESATSVFSALHDFVGSVAHPRVVVSPIAIFREIG